MGLQAGLGWYFEEFKEKSNVDVSLTLSENLKRLRPELELMLFRVVQEGLRNIRPPFGQYHRRFHCPTLTENLPWKFAIKVRECPPKDLPWSGGAGAAGVGLRGMRERVKGFGGELEIVSNLTGTLVQVVIPLGTSAPSAET
jgi:signal transduction histidine kinase